MAQKGLKKWSKRGQKWPFFDHFWVTLGPAFDRFWPDLWDGPYHINDIGSRLGPYWPGGEKGGQKGGPKWGPLFEPWLTKKGFNIYKESHVNGSKRWSKMVKKGSFLTHFFFTFFQKKHLFCGSGPLKSHFWLFREKVSIWFKMSWEAIFGEKVVQESEGSKMGLLEYQRFWPILTILGVIFDMAKNTVFQVGPFWNFLALRNRKSVTRYLCVFLALFDQTVLDWPFLGSRGPKYPFLTLFSLFLTPFLTPFWPVWPAWVNLTRHTRDIWGVAVRSWK